MANQHQDAVLLPPTVIADEESETVQSKEFHSRKWAMGTVWISVFVAVQALLFVSLDLILLLVNTPNYRLQSVIVENYSVRNGMAPLSFNMQLNAQVTLRNRTFGFYKFHDSYLTFSYRGKSAGEASIAETRVKVRSTKTMGIALNVTSEAASRNSSSGTDIASGVVRMTAYSDLRGQVRFLNLYPVAIQHPVADQCPVTAPATSGRIGSVFF